MNCTACSTPYEDGDSFCGQCGNKLPQGIPEPAEFVPLSTNSPTRDQVKRKKKKRKLPLFKILGSVFLVGLILASVAGWMVVARFDSVNSLSTVPSEVRLNADDDSDTVAIDTAPALAALEQSSSMPNLSFASTNNLYATAETNSQSTPVYVQGAAISTQGTPPATLQTASSDNTTGVTVLLMGVDAQSGGEIDVGVRPDSLSVLHLDPETGSCRILGIPRDSRVDLPGYGLTKINHALAVGGVPYQMLVVEQFLGIELDHYGLVDFEGIVGIVDAVGGITVNNPYAFDHLGYHFAEGEIQLEGDAALAFSRYRYGPDGDFGRIDRQQLVMRAVLRELGGVDAVKAVPSLLRAAEGHFKTDFSAMQMVNLANDYRKSCTSSSLETRSLTGENAMFTDPMLNQDLWYVVMAPDDVDDGVRWLRISE